VILDIFSRSTVGWMLAHREQADLAKKLIEETIEKQIVQRDQLIIHAISATRFRSIRDRLRKIQRKVSMVFHFVSDLSY
jgi:transposase InsO family protein